MGQPEHFRGYVYQFLAIGALVQAAAIQYHDAGDTEQGHVLDKLRHFLLKLLGFVGVHVFHSPNVLLYSELSSALMPPRASRTKS